MHTWIFGGGIVGEEDGAVPMGEDAGYTPLAAGRANRARAEVQRLE